MDFEGRRVKVVLRAYAKDAENKEHGEHGEHGEHEDAVVSKAKKVVINVLPALSPGSQESISEDSESVVSGSMVGNARYSSGANKLFVTGQVLWNKSSSSDERKALLESENTAVITDANSGVVLGEVQVKQNGKWHAVLPIGNAMPPCAIDVTFHGKSGAKTVKGVQGCQG